MKKKMSLSGKISFATGLLAFALVFAYGFFVMDGRTKLMEKDYVVLGSLFIIAGISLLFMIAERMRLSDSGFSWKRFGIVVFVLILFGLWRMTT
jgi:hypothetical protein